MEKTTQKELIVESKEILKGQASIRIAHGGEIYVLRITKSDKLILTK